MELCEGGALDDWLQDPEEIIDDATKSRICSEIATGIAYLHMRDVSVVHGDLKAGNVLLTRGKSVRICDFGMSEAKNRSKTMTTANTMGKMALTVAWSAPELFEDDPKSFSTDIYALGVTLWEVYERRVPFGNMPEAAVVSQILAGKRPKFSSSDIPANVKRIIEVCWSARPNERPMADKIAYILTDLWTHHAGRIQEEARARSSAGTPEGSDKAGDQQNLPVDPFVSFPQAGSTDASRRNPFAAPGGLSSMPATPHSSNASDPFAASGDTGKAGALSKKQNLPIDPVPSTSSDTGVIVVEMKGDAAPVDR